MAEQQNFREGDLDTEETPPQEDLSFQVMPGGDLSAPILDSPPPAQGPAQAKVVDLDSVQPAGPEPHQSFSLFKNKAVLVILGVLFLGALGGAAYFLLGTKEDGPKPAISEIPTVWLKQYFNVEVCADQTTCGDKADPDHDGLTNLEEYKVRKQTDPHNPDTDGDGLADGDEEHIYKTSPAAKYTSCTNNTGIACQYDDGSQITNDYDPLTPGMKMDENRKKQITTDTEAYKLHEPTITTLSDTTKPTSDATKPQTIYVTYENGKFTPATVDAKIGDSVIWTNKSTGNIEIASDPHPGHTSAPELRSPILGAGKTYTFVTTKAGAFSYHNETTLTAIGSFTVK